eukprot:SM000145S00821  [mRNA]  locus=s145:288800:290795:- [translate_table: standard]
MNEITSNGSYFNTALIYCLPKNNLSSGNATLTATLIGQGPGGGPLVVGPDAYAFYSLVPATVPLRGQYYDDYYFGTQYFVAVYDPVGVGGAMLAVVAVSNTRAIYGATPPRLLISYVLVPVAPFAPPLPATQPSGPTPTGTSYGFPGVTPKISLLDDRQTLTLILSPTLSMVQSAVAAQGALWVAINSAAASGAVVQYFVLQPQFVNKTLSVSVVSQGALGMPGVDCYFGAIAVNDKRAAIAFTFSGPVDYPSVAYTYLDRLSNGSSQRPLIRLAAAGSAPYDGFTAYTNADFVGRFGEYAGAATDGLGNLYFANEYISSGPREFYTNWATRITKLNAYST